MKADLRDRLLEIIGEHGFQPSSYDRDCVDAILADARVRGQLTVDGKRRRGVRRTYVWRLVVDSWPTPDGGPFASQPPEFWEGIVRAYHAGDALPEWMPDPGPWLATHPNPHKGHYIGDDYEHLLNVPGTPRKRYLTRASLNQHLHDLNEWGCVVHIERAPLGEWTPA